MIRTLGCLPALIRPPFRCSTVPLQARARNGTTTATLRVIYPATNLGPGRATQQVQFNYHIELREDRHYYSVPWRLKGTRVQVLYNDRMVEIYHDHLRVAAHRRARTAGDYTTVADHMPPQHRFYADWSPERILRWGGCDRP